MAQASSRDAQKDAIVRSDVWFEDGNIVIQAEQTQFKIYRGVLVAQSSVFGDMFSIPQPPSEKQKAVDGCPVVRVTDSAIDIAIALRALFLRGYVSRKALSITAVAAFVRIGTKYEIEILRAEGLERLFYEYPSSLSDYDEMNSWSRIDYSWGVNIDVANLAREQNLLSILPVAFYLLCHDYDAKGLTSGVPRDDGTTAMISPTDLITCLVARESLAELQAQTTFAWINLPSTNYSCKTPPKCSKFRMQVMRSLSSHPASICGLDRWGCGLAREPVNSMCIICAEMAELHDDGREKFWNELPDNFGLPEWAEINRERAEFA
ncbi:hypothetical protein FIBSPDRAFT_840249 [Athelia psychrophila]|uniref:BTB domain-containing protein n=1 Tax=Athelia psychrophila TaxID=1759441 RepID=A0A165XCZ7_9AGAM|nr:hypothetical protein FIBSPDRAFT_840249 [Fibularhizoctonia sp. CBS 109695]